MAGVVDGVADELVDGGVLGQAQASQARSLVDITQELVDGADGRSGGGRYGLRG